MAASGGSAGARAEHRECSQPGGNGGGGAVSERK